MGLSDTQRERFQTFGDYSAAAVPFGNPCNGDFEKEVSTILSVPVAQFPLYAKVLPRFKIEISECRNTDGKLLLPKGKVPIVLFQQIIRDELSNMGCDVSHLTNTQMTDYQYWLLFPNVFVQVCAGDATFIINEPHPSGDHNRCVWHVIFLQWRPEGERESSAEPIRVMASGEHYPYNSVLQQDFDQMAIQQAGLRNRLNSEMLLTRSEPRVAHFHNVLSRWVGKS